MRGRRYNTMDMVALLLMGLAASLSLCSVSATLTVSDAREVNLYSYSRDYEGTYGKVYQMGLGNVVDDGFDLVDGGNANPGDVTYIRGYYSQPQSQWYDAVKSKISTNTLNLNLNYSYESQSFTELKVCSMEQTSGDGVTMTFHTLFRRECQAILDFIPQGTTGSVSELARIFVPSEERDDLQLFRVVLCQGHNDLLYGIITRSFPFCPHGQYKLHEFDFYAIGGALFCPDIKPSPGMDIFYELKHENFKKTALITCNPPYRLNTTECPPHQSVLECSENGRWLGEILGCEYIDCGAPPLVVNGRFNGSSYGYQHSVEMICEDGYEIKIQDQGLKVEDAVLLHCMNSSQWSPVHSSCQPKDCGPPPSVKHGAYKGSSSSYKYPNTLDLVCVDGYIKTAENIQRCDENGQWSDNVTLCDPVTCGKPSSPDNGRLIGKDFSYDDQVAFSCDMGYAFSKNTNYVRCLANGTWEANYGTCERIVCDNLNAPSHGSIQVDNFEFGSYVNFTCNNGYNLVGSETFECLENDGKGSWSGEPPICRAIECTEPTNIIQEHGTIIMNETTLDSEINFECEEGFKLKASSTCGPTGWSNVELSCERDLLAKLFDNQLPHEGNVRLVNGTSLKEGRVEMYRHEQWTTVCISDFQEVDAQVVCRQLGLSGGIAETTERFGKGSVPNMYMHSTACTGAETRLLHCGHDGSRESTRSHNKNVGVICS